MKMVRIRGVVERVNRCRSAIYNDCALGLFPKPVKIGPRAAAWPSNEVDAIITARIRGESEDEIRRLVSHLEAARKTFRITEGPAGRREQ